MHIAVIGDIVLDILMWSCQRLGDAVVCSESYMDAGGSSNIAIALKRLGADKVYAVGLVGCDSAGDIVVKSLREENIDTSFIARHGSTSKVIAYEIDNGVRYVASIHRLLGSNVLEIDWGMFDIAIVNGNTATDLSSIDTLIVLVRELPRYVDLVAIDLGYGAYVDSFINAIMGLDSPLTKKIVVLGTENEISRLSTNPIDLSRRFMMIAMKMGSRGAKLYVEGRELFIEARKIDVRPIRTISAGDVFTATLVLCIYRGFDYRTCLELACRAAEKKIVLGLIGRTIPRLED